MATLFLSTAAGMLGGEAGAFGALAGPAATALNRAMAGGDDRLVEGPRMTSVATLSSTEGAPIPRVYGRARIGGQMIWATRFLETSTVSRSGGAGGKSATTAARGLGLATGGTQTLTTSYAYAANFAIGLCEGPIAFVRRIWADGKEIDRTTFTHRVYTGDAAQQPDPLIVAKEGAGSAPAYRGLAYVVFEAFPLAPYGNRIPQLTFEVVRPTHGLCEMIRAVDLIPGAGEYVYAVPALVQSYAGVTTSENRMQLAGASDWSASLDALQALCPNLRCVALVVSWFGDDMRAGACRIEPCVESRDKQVAGVAWGCAGRTRDTARLVSRVDGRPAYGGTPSDDMLQGALADLRARGLQTLFVPFVMMDSQAPGQPRFGWRGDVAPAAADGTQVAADEIAQFFADDNYRAMILHYARPCAGAGGVEAFLVGSELRGLPRVRDAAGAFPAVQALARLAGDAKAILGPATKISYAADWSEYGALVRDNGREVRFPLDALWACPAIDVIGIDAYFPLADWRQGRDHIDAASARSVYDRDYLRRNLGAGEFYEWFYASEADRAAQRRTPISDGAFGKPWMFRAKDLVNWWSQPHVERAGGVETGPTAFVPRSKPIWFVEAGCPAVDLGANAPNVFPDARAATQNLPPFSNGARDDLMQTRGLEAFLSRFDPRCDGFDEAFNPRTPDGRRMVDPDHIYLWAYDARPFPAFPMLSTTWSDAPAWDTGHWLNGRLESAPLDRLLVDILADFASVPIAPPPIDAIVEGYVVDRPLSARGVIEPLCSLFGFDAAVTAGEIRFGQRGDGAPVALGEDDLAPRDGGALVEITRADDSRLPHELSLAFTDAEWDYRPASVLSRRLEGATRRHADAETALILRSAVAQQAADLWLQDTWAARERAQAALRPGLAGLECGDLVRLPGAGARIFRVTRKQGHFPTLIEARAVDLALLAPPRPSTAPRISAPAPALPGPPRVEILDLAIDRGDGTLQYLAAFADPWPGALAVHAVSGGGTAFIGALSRPCAMGETLEPLGPGPTGRFDRANALRVRLRGGYLSSASDIDALAGRNTLALRGPDGRWEIVAFAVAELVAENEWRLSRLLRGLGGEDALASRTLAAGATVVLLDSALLPVAQGVGDLGLERTYLVGPADRDLGDPSYVRILARAGGLALRPYAPVRPRARRTASGVEIAFIRRGRLDADGWEALDIPLGEASESYLVEILVDGAVKRAIACAAPEALYAATDEIADFGAPQPALALRITQLSAAVGRGFPLEATIPIL